MPNPAQTDPRPANDLLSPEGAAQRREKEDPPPFSAPSFRTPSHLHNVLG